jgi:effector-binding domain-containing protein
MTYQCELQERPAQHTLSLRTRTSVDMLPEIFGKTFAAIAQYLAGIGEEPAGPPYAAYYNMDMQDLDVEIGFSVAKPLPSKGEIQSGQIPGGKFAACLYTGPYSDIEPVYTALSAWIKEQDLVVTGVAYELYLNDPAHTPPQQLQTQILFPLVEAA